MNMCTGPLETFNSFCGRRHSTLDYIFVPNCLLSSTESAKTFEANPDNTPEHLPIQMTLNFAMNDNSALYHGDPQCSKKKSKIVWSEFSLVDVNTKYVTPLSYELEKGDIDPTDSERAVEKISKLLCFTRCSSVKKENKRNVYVRLPDDVKTARSHCKIAFESWKEKIILMRTRFAKITVQNVGSIVSNYAIFSTNLKPKKSRNFAAQHIIMRSYFGDS